MKKYRSGDSNCAVTMIPEGIHELHIYDDYETFIWHLKNDNMIPLWGSTDVERQCFPIVFVAGR